MTRTLIEALSDLPRSPTHGFRFVDAKLEVEHFHSFEALGKQAYQYAAGLAELGLKRGDRLALVR